MVRMWGVDVDSQDLTTLSICPFCHRKFGSDALENKLLKRMDGVIKHIGHVRALCGSGELPNLNDNLGLARYRELGVTELFKGEQPYTVCEKCIEVIIQRADPVLPSRPKDEVSEFQLTDFFVKRINRNSQE